MFRRIEAKNYRCLKDVSIELNPFEILVGANASGKSSFLDVIDFLHDLVSEGAAAAVERRSSNFHDLVWGRQSNSFSLCVYTNPVSAAIRYEIVLKLDVETERVQIASEVAWTLEPGWSIDRDAGRVRFQSAGNSWDRDLTGAYSVLNSLPSDAEFSSAARLRDLLRENIQIVTLNGRDLAKPAPPGSGNTRTQTGLGLARQILHLKSKRSNAFQAWLTQIRTALPDICNIDSVLREEDQHRYVVVEYANGVRVPSWMLSEGTLRLLALTILAYLPDSQGVYLIEEPENGVHPTALETIFQSLSSVYDAQVLLATHSPVLLSLARPEQILCFSKTPDGTRIVRGSEHPALKEWQGEVSLGTMAASGILG